MMIAHPFNPSVQAARLRAGVGDRIFYRYLPHQYADTLISRGEFWITTLERCRCAENAARGDKGEGTVTQVVPERVVADSQAALPPLLQEIAEIGPGSKRIAFESVAVKGSLDDLYLLCVSEILDEQVMRAFDGDACIRVDNPVSVILALSHAMRDYAELVTFAPVRYSNRVYHHSAALPAPIYLLKPPSNAETGENYARQHEWRAVWRPLTGEIEGRTVISMRAAGFCTRIV